MVVIYGKVYDSCSVEHVWTAVFRFWRTWHIVSQKVYWNEARRALDLWYRSTSVNYGDLQTLANIILPL